MEQQGGPQPRIILQGQRDRLKILKAQEGEESVAMQTYRDAHPGDEEGLNAFREKLRVTREEIREIEGKKEGKRDLKELEEIAKKPSPTITEIPAISSIDGATQESPAINVPASPVGKKEDAGVDAIQKLKDELAGRGISLDNLEGKNFDQLLALLNVLGTWLNLLEKEALPGDVEVIKFIKDQRIKVEELLEIASTKENRRLPKAEYERLQEEFNKAGMSLGMYDYLDLPKLLLARKILEEREKRFLNNREVVEHLNNVNIHIKEKEGVGDNAGTFPIPEEIKGVEPKGEKKGWTAEEEEALKTALATKAEAEKIIRTAQEKLAEIGRQLEGDSGEESELVASLKERLSTLEGQLKNTWKIRLFKREREDLEAEIRNLKWEIEDAEDREAFKRGGAERKEAIERKERERKEAIERDKERNPFKYFLIGKISDPAFEILCAATKENISLERLNGTFGESGETLNTSLYFKNISPINFNTVWLTSNGFSLQLENKEGVQGEEDGKKVIMIYDPRAKYKLVYPDWTHRSGETALNHQEGRRLMEQRAREFQEQLLTEFKAKR